MEDDVEIKWGESLTIHGAIVPPRKSLKNMTSLSGVKCHNHTMKRVYCDPHIVIIKTVILKWCPLGHPRAKIDECHDVIKEDDPSSNTPKRSALKPC